MRMISEVLEKHKQYCVVFLDDVLIFSETQEEHESHVRKIQESIRLHNFLLKENKCSFFAQEVNFLGFDIGKDGIKITEEKIKAIVEWPMVKSPKDVRSFLGLAGVYRRFTPHFALYALPLFKLLNLDQTEFEKLIWREEILSEVKSSMVKLKEVICQQPALSLPEKDNLEFIVRTDASGFAEGATLRKVQEQGGKGAGEEKVLAYFSRKLTDAESRYSTYDKELLAIRDALSHWRYYLLGGGRRVKVSTDHASLRHVLTQPKLSPRQMRVLQDLQEYDLEIDYLPGAKNYIQDALSRRPDYKDPLLPRLHRKIDDMELSTLIVEEGTSWLKQIKQGYLKDPYFRDVLNGLNGIVEERVDCAKIQRAKFRQQQARLRFYWLDPEGFIIHTQTGALCIPSNIELRNSILYEAHDSLSGGHFGARRTASAIAQRFYWPRLFQETKKYVHGCATCHRTKSSNQVPYGLLQPLDIPENRWERINIDFITKLPTTESGNDTIVTFIDGLTKRAHWVATREAMSAAEFAQLFLEYYVRLHGLPNIIVSDRDVRFTSDFWKKLMEIWKTKLSMSTAFHPQTDGQAEKANSIVERYLRAYATNRQRTWDRLLPLAEFAYNSTIQTAIGMTPFEADIGYVPRMPLDSIAAVRQGSVAASPSKNKKRSNEANSMSSGQSFAQRMHDIMVEIRQNLFRTQEDYITSANKHRRPHTFQTGDKVYISTRNLPLTYVNDGTTHGKPDNSHRKALQHRYMGEFELGKARGENAFEIADFPKHWKLSRTVNVDVLKKSTVDHSRQQDGPPPLRIERNQGFPDAEASFELEKILSKRRNPDKKGRLEYEVKWVGEEECTWEPLENLTHAEEALSDFGNREVASSTLSDSGRELETQKPLRRSGRRRRQRILNLLHGRVLAEHDDGKAFIVSRDTGDQGEIFIISMGNRQRPIMYPEAPNSVLELNTG